MRRALFPLLACPGCRSATLDLQDGAVGTRDTVESGELRCRRCDRSFAVRDGVPKFLLGQHSKGVQRAFSSQWRLRLQGNFEGPEQIYCLSHATRADDLAGKLGDVLADESSDDWILDAGCGTGELVRALAWRYPSKNFVGMDFADTLRDAASKQQVPPNLDYVQADVGCTPFLAERFRAVVSLGVLHHTANTRTAVESIAGLVRVGGKLSIWLYPHPSDLTLLDSNSRRSIAWYYRLRDRVFLERAHLLPPKLLYWILKLLLAPIYVLPIPSVPPYTNSSRRQLHAGLVFVLFDDLVPEFQHRHTKREVIGWFAELGMSDVKSGPPSHDSNHSLGSFTGTKISGGPGPFSTPASLPQG